MAFDYGSKTIGVAVGQGLTQSATELAEIRNHRETTNWDALSKVIAEWQPDCFVVGMPLNMDGSESEFGEAVKKFVRQLEGRFNKKVFLMDERLSSYEAKQIAGPTDSYRDNPVDSLAARLILESWFKQ